MGPSLKTVKTYKVHSSFLTIQGEGHWMGRRAVFVRFVGCNIWSGHEKHRARDSMNSACALICDTRFIGMDRDNGGGIYTADQLIDRIVEVWEAGRPPAIAVPFVVFTGGEPSLQLDEELVSALNSRLVVYTAVETNGNRPIPRGITWVTLSPKPPSKIHDPGMRFDEVKVLYPLFDPLTLGLEDLEWFKWAQKFVSPLDRHTTSHQAEWRECAKFVLANPGWRMNIQLHKLVGLE